MLRTKTFIKKSISAAEELVHAFKSQRLQWKPQTYMYMYYYFHKTTFILLTQTSEDRVRPDK